MEKMVMKKVHRNQTSAQGKNTAIQGAQFTEEKGWGELRKKGKKTQSHNAHLMTAKLRAERGRAYKGATETI